MKLIITGVPKEYVDGLTVAKLIELEQVETPEHVIVSVDDESIHNDTFAETVLKDGNSVEFFYFTGGGAI